MKYQSGRLWRKLIPVLLAISVLALPLGVAGKNSTAPESAYPDNIIHLLERLEQSADPEASYFALSSEDREALDAYIAVASVETINGPVRAFEATTTQADTYELAATSSCWTYTVRVNGKNYYGQTMWSYFQKIDWCGNGTTITDILRRQRWGEVYHSYWSWIHIDNATSGGEGKNWYWAFTQAEFKYCFGGWCQNHRYPKIEMTVKPDGRVYGSWSS